MERLVALGLALLTTTSFAWDNRICTENILGDGGRCYVSLDERLTEVERLLEEKLSKHKKCCHRINGKHCIWRECK